MEAEKIETKEEKVSRLFNTPLYISILKEAYTEEKPSADECKIIANQMKKINLHSKVDSVIPFIQFHSSLLSGYPHKCSSWTESKGEKDDIKNFKSNIMCFDFDKGIADPEKFERAANKIFHVVQRSISWGLVDKKSNKIEYKYHCYLILDGTITDPSHYQDVYDEYLKRFEKQFKLKLDSSIHATKYIFAGQSKGITTNPYPLAPILEGKTDEEIIVISDEPEKKDVKLSINYEALKECMQLLNEKGCFDEYDDWLKGVFGLIDLFKNEKIDYRQLHELGKVIDDGQRKTAKKINDNLKYANSKREEKITSKKIYYLCKEHGFEDKAQQAFGFGYYSNVIPFTDADAPPIRKQRQGRIQKSQEQQQEQLEQQLEQQEQEDWKDHLEYGTNPRTGEKFLKKNERNIELILENEFGDIVEWDDFSSKITLTNDLPWRTISEDDDEWLSHDHNQLEHWFGTQWDVTGKSKIENAFVHVTQKRSHHPIKDFIESAVWDGEIRVPSFFVDYLGAEDSVYTQEITKRWFTGAVKRIYCAGCEFEIVPALVGDKGLGKSKVGYLLANKKWHTDSIVNLDPKVSGEILADSWIVEFPEMEVFKRKTPEEIKSFLSSKSDKYRGAYEHGNARDHKRHSVFYATSNKIEIIKDDQERRQFPIKCSRNRKYNPHEELTPEIVVQIWAEAKVYFEMGYFTYIDDELQLLADEVYLQFKDTDPLQEDVQIYAANILQSENRVHLCEREIWDKVISNDPKNKPTRRDADRIKGILSSLGYERMEKKQKCGKDYGSRICYMKK